MRIERLQGGYVGPAAEAPKSGRKREGAESTATRGTRDSVQISGTARALAEQYANEGLTPARIQTIRHQIQAGSYNQPEAVEELAWRLIESGIV